MAAIKYRPYLTSPELTEIISSLKSTGSNLSLIQYLQSFQDKISVGKIAPQITTKPTLSDKLELSGNMVSVDLVSSRLAAYNKWLSSPSKCSIQELARARMYRYENDLMSEAEEAEYESVLDKGY